MNLKISENVFSIICVYGFWINAKVCKPSDVTTALIVHVEFEKKAAIRVKLSKVMSHQVNLFFMLSITIR